MNELQAALMHSDMLLDAGFWVHIQVTWTTTKMDIGKVRDDGVREACIVSRSYYKSDGVVKFAQSVHS